MQQHQQDSLLTSSRHVNQDDSEAELRNLSAAMTRTRQLITNSREHAKRETLKKITHDNKRLYQRIINICT